jgi:hypothetical protein
VPESQPIRVYFPDHRAGERVVPLALAAGIGRGRIEDGLTPEAGRFDRLLADGAQSFVAAPDLTGSDLCCYPHAVSGGKMPPEALEMARTARAAGKPALFFDFGDDDSPAELRYGLLYRTSLKRRQKGPREEAMPAPCRRVNAQGTRPRQVVPRVGFCGYVAGAWKRALMLARGQHRNLLGHRMRARSLRGLNRAAGAGLLETDFIIHRHFGGGFLRFREDAERIETARAKFERNIANTDYTLCVRGAGNFSVRFYETLSAGRTPLLVDTDCVLPLEDEIDWSNHLVRVEEGRAAECGTILTDAHRGTSEKRFEERQESNRRLWETRLEPLAFLRHACAKALTRGTP